MAPTEMRRFVEYHLLLGSSLLVVLDNLCDSAAEEADKALAPYATLRRVVQVKLRCTAWSGSLQTRGYSLANRIVQQKMPLGSLVWRVDEDEFVVLDRSRRGLQPHSLAADGLPMLAAMMEANKVCALFSKWRQFGTNGHICQPNSSLVGSFTRRSPIDGELNATERQNAIRIAAAQLLNPPFPMSGRGAPGKAFWLHGRARCGVHGCTGCTDRGWTNCGLPQHLTSKTCVPLAAMTHINHYAYQSQQAWASKTTNNVIKRRGDVPIFYEQVEDRAALQMVQSRVHLVHDLNASRDAQCLLDLFFRGTTHGRELSSPTQLPETSHGSTTFEPTFQSKLRRMLHEASIQSPPQRPAEFRTVNAKGTCATDSSGFKCRKRLGCCGSLGLLPSNASLSVQRSHATGSQNYTKKLVPWEEAS